MDTSPPATAPALALHGGRPVRMSPLPYGRHLLTEDDIQAVVEVLRSDRLTTGPKVAEFEDALAAHVGARHAVAFSSGTAALHAAAFAAGLAPGDEAITTPLTFCATANAVLYQGARPVFADIDDDTLNLSPDEVAGRLTARTKALIPVDYAGHPAELEALMDLAAKRGAVVIEDATHALGAQYRGRRIGGISHMTVFSFHPVKLLTTGEGGMVTANDPTFARRLRMFRHHGIDQDPAARDPHRPWYYEMTALGYNYRLSDINCALGLSQLTRLEAALTRRAQIVKRYDDAFQKLPGIRLPTVHASVRHAWHLYPIRLDPASFRLERDEILRALRAEGLEVTIHFLPVYRHPYYRKRFGTAQFEGTCPVAETAHERLMSLPLFHSMTDGDVDDVIEGVHKVVRVYAR